MNRLGNRKALNRSKGAKQAVGGLDPHLQPSSGVSHSVTPFREQELRKVAGRPGRASGNSLLGSEKACLSSILFPVI